MPLIEIISGEKTNASALARAFDFSRQLGKTAIVVNDSVGFFTSRVFATFLDEGTRLLREGVDPVSIDNLGRQIGMPVGPLAVHDEVSQALTHKVAQTQRALGLLGTKYDIGAAEEVCALLIEQYGRGGRYHGGGFYEYSGKSKRIWPKLYELFQHPSLAMPAQDIKDRLLFRQVIESIKCLQEGVLRSVADANIGSVLGIGAPSWTGGFLQFVNTYGVDAFRARATQLAEHYGPRFSPPAMLARMTEHAETFQ
jgi:3-hydroxyacyl-CoA dehydrogenase/enoyl-CoA hydratase/3-hydroxybutyryl-CoA epimerase